MTVVTKIGAVGSPCINICKMHETTGWCEGCLRTLDEIAGWGQFDDAARRQVLQGLRSRRVTWRALRAAGQIAGLTDQPDLPDPAVST